MVFQHDGTTTDRIYKGAVPWTVDHPKSPDKVIDMIPGLNEYVTYKASLVTRGGKYIPKGFYLPQDINSFIEYTSKPENKNKIWIQKNPRFRGNYVRKLTELDLSNVSLVQEFISNPFLITGRKFSQGVFVAFSSARPLRAYVLDKFMISRYCDKLYDPTDLSDPRTYVTDGMERGAGVNILDKLDAEAELVRTLFFGKNYHARKTMEVMLLKRGKDPSSFLPQIFDSIRDVLNTSLVHMLKHNVSTERKYTWTSPGNLYRNQIDYILIKQRWKTNVKNCRTFPGADIDSDHNLLYADFKLRLKILKKARTLANYDIQSLQDVSIKEKYQVEISNTFQALTNTENTPEELWCDFKDNIHKAANKVLGKGKQRNHGSVRKLCKLLIQNISYAHRASTQLRSILNTKTQEGC
ncbi:probable tubulin polyglutamylase ttll-15 [Amphiura filiformis]|uniref:probable tubulin polyglutamylase ttll-15 n=1 Tax=Amphiura filiformis TaxID=82378 RepID=UPI003B20F552